MKIEVSPALLFSFVKKNWFTFSLLLLGLYIYFRKDLSFQIQVLSPNKIEQNLQRQPREKMTENAIGNHKATDRLEMPFIVDQRWSKNALKELAKIKEAEKQAFMERFAKVALKEQEKFGIPASIILGLSLYQSYAGNREIAVAANNFFALPCSPGWQGNCVEAQGIRYRRYQTAWASFRDFSLFANEKLGHVKGKDFKLWAQALAEAGISEQGQLDKHLIQIIEAYKLFQLDK